MTDLTLTPEEARTRLIRRSDMVACKVAFIDCKTPGSHLKENYALIGPGVTTSPDQVVNLREPHGFNIGAAAMPHGIRNNLHLHFTAEVFLCLRGDWTFRWGPDGGDGEITGHAGTIASIPTWIFRGFTNVGPDDGIIFTVLGGDDTGGIIWHPSILGGAAEHGLYLTKDSLLVDTTAGAAKPAEDELTRPIAPEEIARLRRYSVAEMRARIVTAEDRAWTHDALLDSCLPGHASEMAPVIGAGMNQDRDVVTPIAGPHGFSVEWLRLPPGQSVSRHRLDRKQVLMGHAGAATVTLNAPGAEVPLPLNAQDTLSVPANAWRSIANAADVPAEIIVVTSGDGRATPDWAPEVVEAAHAVGRAVDRSGTLAPAHLLPDYVMGRRS